MSSHYNTDTIQPTTSTLSCGDGLTLVNPIRDEPLDASETDRPQHLPNGARIICSDKRSQTVLCVQGGRWSVWCLTAGGNPLRGSYFKTLRAASFDYAERIMGCHAGDRDGVTIDTEE